MNDHQRQNMKRILITLTLASTLQMLTAQERLPRDEALKYAALAGADAKQLLGTPIPTRVDLEQPVALKDGEYGGMVLPELKLTAEAITRAGDKVVPLGQLWLLKLTPMRDGEATSSDQLRLATVKHGDTEVTLPQCALGAQRNKSGGLELLVFGKAKEPILKVPMKSIDTKQESPIELDAERNSDSADITVKILGKYEATLKVTELAL
jgi:hypothetical protein